MNRKKKKDTKAQTSVQKKSIESESKYINRTDFWLVLAFLGLTILLFHGILNFDKTIISSDYNVWSAKYLAEHIRAFTWQKWLPYNHAGGDFAQAFYPTFLLLFFLSPSFWLGFNYALHIFLLGTFMYCWVRYLGLNRTASFYAAVCMMLTNHVVTLVFPGHMGKFNTFAWTPLTFLFFAKGIKERKLLPFIIAGGFFGMQFLGSEVQVATYLGVCLAAYLVYLLIFDYLEHKQIKPILQSIGGFGLMAGITFLVAFHVIYHLFFFGFLKSSEQPGVVKGKKAIATASSAAGKEKQTATVNTDADSGFEFSTSWSFPPEEVLTLFMNRPFGDYSGAEGEKAYWGRLGSKNMILKLSDDYFGIIPIIFALIALWFVRKRDILFWVIVGLVALLLSFGGFTPIYKYVLMIPGMNKFRDPNKWIFIVTFCFTTVAGYGMHWYSTYIMQSKPQEQIKDKKVQILIYTLIGIVIFSILLSFIGLFFKESIITSILATLSAKGISVDYAVALSRFNGMLLSWVRMTILLIIGIGLIYAGFKWRVKKEYIRYLLITVIAITALDLGVSASRFLQYQDSSEVYSLDPVTAFLKNDRSYYRVKLYSGHPFLENLTNFKLKYYEIPAWDIAASRLPKLYNNFLREIAETNFGTFLDVANVKYMLGDQPLNHPAFRQVYNIGRFYVNQYLGFVPRVFTISKFEVIPDEDRVIERMKSSEFNLRNGVIVESNPGFSSSTTSDYNPTGAEITQYTPNQVTIETKTSIQSLLVFHDYYTPDWKAYIDGKPTKILKTDYLMRSIVVPSGMHTAVFKYEPNMIGLYVSMLSVFIFAGFLIYLGWHWWIQDRNTKKGRVN